MMRPPNRSPARGRTPRLDKVKARLQSQAARLSAIMNSPAAPALPSVTLAQLQTVLANVSCGPLLVGTAFQQRRHRIAATARPGVDDLRLSAVHQLITPLHRAAHERRA